MRPLVEESTILKKITNSIMAHKNGFITINYRNNVQLLVYMDVREISLYDKEREEYLEFYREENLNGLAFENQLYYKYSDLEVLKEYSFIEHLLIAQSNIEDFSGVRHVTNLKGLYISGNKSKFDFRLVKNQLETLSISWHRKLTNLSRLLGLKFLHIEKDHNELLLPRNIEKLEMWKSKRTNLDFSKDLTNLKKMELYSNSKLTNVDGITHLSQNLEELEIEKCKKIEDYSPILSLKNLKKLKISHYDKDQAAHLRDVFHDKNLDFLVSIYPSLK